MKKFNRFIVAVLAIVGAIAPSEAVNACQITWDDPGSVGWIEGIRFYSDGAPTETPGAVVAYPASAMRSRRSCSVRELRLYRCLLQGGRC